MYKAIFSLLTRKQGLLITALFSLMSANQAHATFCLTPPAGMSGWWPGDQNAQDIIGNNSGTFNAGTFVSPAKVGSAFTFSGTGNDYVIVPQNSSLEPKFVTVDAWVRANGTPGQFKYIVAKGGNNCDGGSSYALYTGNSGGLAFYIYDGSTFVLSPDAGASIWNNAWHHVAGSYDGANVKLYVDGGLIGATPTSLTINYALHDNQLIFGNYTDCNSGQNFAFKGDVDEIEIFNRALTASEVNAIYAADSVGKCKTIQVTIDIRSREHHKCFCVGDRSTIPVVIFGTSQFDVRNIDVSTLKLNGASVHGKNPKCTLKDVNHDGIADYVCRFNGSSSTWNNGTLTATLTGNLKDHTPITGTDSLCTIPVKDKKELSDTPV